MIYAMYPSVLNFQFPIHFTFIYIFTLLLYFTLELVRFISQFLNDMCYVIAWFLFLCLFVWVGLCFSSFVVMKISQNSKGPLAFSIMELIKVSGKNNFPVVIFSFQIQL